MQETPPASSGTIDVRIAWTTVATTTEAESLAASIMDSRLAACVQVDSPVRSMFRWEGKLESSAEIRLWIKYPGGNEQALQKLVSEQHPYDVPQWITVGAEAVAKAYGDWIMSMTSLD